MSSRTTENAPSTDEAAIIGAGRVNRRYVNGVFLALAAALLAGLVFFKHGPQSASASQSGPGGMAFDEFLTGELPGIRSVDGALSNADKIVEEFKFAPARVQVPLMELKVNPFRQGAAGAAPADSQEDSATHDLREQERQAALQAVQSLRLESITHRGSNRACTINSVRYQEGQEAAGFLVEEIASNIVVVRKGAYRFELKPSS